MGHFARSFAKRNGFSEPRTSRLVFLLSRPKELLYYLLCTLSKDPQQSEALELYNRIMSIPERDVEPYRDEIDFLKDLPAEEFLTMPIYPYSQARPFPAVKTGFDRNFKLPFVWHRDKRLFFPKTMTEKSVAELYSCYISKEGITGEGCLSKSPHCYQTKDFKIDDKDIVLDVGSAEGTFALDALEKAEKVYVFEADKDWAVANKATFDIYHDKVTTINKYVGAETTESTIKLDDALLSENNQAHYFIKMDIEGAEISVLQASMPFLEKHKVKLACTVYHRPDDARHIEKLLVEHGFTTEFSDGYTLIGMGGFRYPYFRKCLIRAKNF